MEELNKFNKISVIGAAGKMGRGITLVILIQLLKNSLICNDCKYKLNLIDKSEEGLNSLISYLKNQIEKTINSNSELKYFYLTNSMFTNEESIINDCFFKLNKFIETSTKIELAYNSSLVFEAINEDLDLKGEVINAINVNSKNSPWVLSNTSSIPINELEKKAFLSGNIIGFHFYNPPYIQKLVEIIPSKTTDIKLVEFANMFANNIGKKVIISGDYAGFIGNGIFMREVTFATKIVNNLTENYSLPEAIYIVNQLTKDYLLRPMGIFQLCDYVGLDVCNSIMQIINSRINEHICSDLITDFLQNNIKGGQDKNGVQKNGIFNYENNNIIEIYDFSLKKYIEISSFENSIKHKIGFKKQVVDWRSLLKNKDKEMIMNTHFSSLKASNSIIDTISIEYGNELCKIGENIISNGIANNSNDINEVMINGFAHLYGPINNFFIKN